jgi:hypothetical protein
MFLNPAYPPQIDPAFSISFPLTERKSKFQTHAATRLAIIALHILIFKTLTIVPLMSSTIRKLNDYTVPNYSLYCLHPVAYHQEGIDVAVNITLYK